MLEIALAAVGIVAAYAAFMGFSFWLARLLFPKIELNEADEKRRMVKLMQQRKMMKVSAKAA